MTGGASSFTPTSVAIEYRKKSHTETSARALEAKKANRLQFPIRNGGKEPLLIPLRNPCLKVGLPTICPLA